MEPTKERIEKEQHCGNCGLPKSVHEGTGFTHCPKPFGGIFSPAFTLEVARENMKQLFGITENDRAQQELQAYRDRLKEAFLTEPEPQENWTVSEIIQLIDVVYKNNLK